MIYSFQIANRYMYVKWTNFFQKTVNIWETVIVNIFVFKKKVLHFGLRFLSFVKCARSSLL